MRTLGSKRGTYLACTIGLKPTILEDVEVDEEEEVEVVDEDGEVRGEK